MKKIIIIILCFSTNLFAADKNHIQLEKVETYLNQIHNLTASFVQKNSEGEVAEGKFYLSRPGKMRLEYSKPNRLLLLVNNEITSYQDLELKENSQIKTEATPASLLTRKNISFVANDVKITEFSETADITRVGVMKRNKEDSGEFILIFKNNPLALARLEVHDSVGNKTIVTLYDIKWNATINQSIFDLPRPEAVIDRTRR